MPPPCSPSEADRAVGLRVRGNRLLHRSRSSSSIQNDWHAVELGGVLAAGTALTAHQSSSEDGSGSDSDGHDGGGSRDGGRDDNRQGRGGRGREDAEAVDVIDAEIDAPASPRGAEEENDDGRTPVATPTAAASEKKRKNPATKFSPIAAPAAAAASPSPGPRAPAVMASEAAQKRCVCVCV